MLAGCGGFCILRRFLWFVGKEPEVNIKNGLLEECDFFKEITEYFSMSEAFSMQFYTFFMTSYFMTWFLKRFA